MKKGLSVLLAMLIVFSVFAIFTVPSMAAEPEIMVTKISGALTAPGTSETYLITDGKGQPIENFSAKYTIEKNLKLPLSVSNPKSIEDGTLLEIKVLDTCSTEDIKLEGTVKIVNIEDKSKSYVVFTADGTTTIKNTVTKVNGDISITTSSGSRLYDFSTSAGNLNIYFGEDAAIQMHGIETGSKCLAYNIDPNQTLKTKYSLTGKNSAFINFIGEPEFKNTITVKFAIPVSSSNTRIYQLKEGTSNELEEIANAKITTSGTDEFIYFETNKLASTYVITAEPIEGVEAAKPVVKEEPVVKEPEIEKPNPTEPEIVEPPVDDTVKSPQTGSNSQIYLVCIMAMSVAVAIMIAFKKKY